MAIRVREDLTASPSPTALPRRIDFKQTLASTRDEENIDVVYEMTPLEPGQPHDVWFLDSQGAQVKRVERQETLTRAAKICHDRISLEHGEGRPVDLVQIDQTLTDAAGRQTSSVVEIQILR